MTRRITVSLDDDIVEQLNRQMNGYGDNRSEWVEEAIRRRLTEEVEA